MTGKWSAPKHCGLQQCVDHAISVIGRDQLKPTTECLGGVATYPKGDMIQGRYAMALTDLGNCFYDQAVDDGRKALKVGGTDNKVAVGDLIEMLLSILFACKDGLPDWEWLGINPVEGPLQRLDWEIYRIEHLVFASDMESSMQEWLQAPWHIWICCS